MNTILTALWWLLSACFVGLLVVLAAPFLVIASSREPEPEPEVYEEIPVPRSIRPGVYDWARDGGL